MLQSLREQSGKWFIKVLFSAIIASFVVWGVGDMIRSYNSLRPVAKVGGHTISYDEFAHALQQELSHLQQITKGKITSAHLQSLGIHSQILEKLINQAALKEELKRSDLSVSERLVRHYIHAIPAFQHEGSFNKALFLDLLRNNNLTEGQFIQDVKQSLLTQQLISPLVGGVKLPKSYKELLFKTLNEEKVFTVVSIPLSKVKLEKAPTEEELNLFYSQHKEQYTVPEFRTVTIALLDTKALLESVPVTEEEIKEEYEKRQADFTHAEKRAVKRLSYPTKALAEEALARLKMGRPMPAVTRDVKGGSYEDMGTIEKSQLPESVADTVFELTSGTHTSAIENTLGYSIYQVTKVEQAHTDSLDQVKKKLTEEIRLQKSSDYLQEIKNKIEDELAAGKPFADVAKEHKLKIEALAPFNQGGLTSDGKSAFVSLPAPAKKHILEQAFSLNEQNESPVIDIDQNLSCVVRVEKIKPTYVPELTEIKDKVTKDWAMQQQAQEAAKLAYNLSQEAKSLADLTTMANKHGFTVLSNQTLSRMQAEEPTKNKKDKEKPNALKELLSPELLNKIFLLGVGKSTSGQTVEGFAVVMLQKVAPLSINQKKLDTFSQTLDQMVEKDISNLVLQSFRHHHPVSINEEILKQITQE